MNQSRFRAALLDPGQPAPPGLTGPGGGPAARRFGIYRNNVTASLTEALRQSFPVVRALVGEDFFTAMAIAHLRAHPGQFQVRARGYLVKSVCSILKIVEHTVDYSNNRLENRLTSLFLLSFEHIAIDRDFHFWNGVGRNLSRRARGYSFHQARFPNSAYVFARLSICFSALMNA